MAKKKKDNRMKKILIGIFMSIFMISSIGSVMIYYGNNNNDENKFTAEYSGKEYVFMRKVDNSGFQYYEVSSESRSFTAFYLPEQLSYIDADNASKEKIRESQAFYLVFDPESQGLTYIDYLRFELGKNIPPEKYFFEGITSESEIYQLPILTCQNASEFVPVIIIENANSTKISSTGNCIRVEFASHDISRVLDLLIYLEEGIEI
ncbi:hypothetical protein JXC34_06300 [Candidatus Woesearchaeota archaeon]|nr:hypothetical protein [Candidatus Woesearchaeota archaeon]